MTPQDAVDTLAKDHVARQTDDVVDIGRIALAFGRVERATFHDDGRRHETDTDHTAMLGLLCASLMRFEQLNHADVLRFVLVHDLVEADPECGDTNTLAPVDDPARLSKPEREAAALQRLRERFTDNVTDWIPRWIERYERQDCAEARFVRFVDKLCPRITHQLNACATPRGMGWTLEQWVAHCVEHEGILADYVKEFPRVGAIWVELRVRAAAIWPAPVPKACNRHIVCAEADGVALMYHREKALHCYDESCRNGCVH